ncbi:hypothetical protein E8E13_003527 [Curvularia kusanoi]|uniref:N2227-domain-containing protein n=1 Tax=Curvularia kusanoi TaxID=90978 RepID=A0A9P4T5E4_CURKU|nr:hypothetical protein E8E13_003527 [Curvularia kusanoi]
MKLLVAVTLLLATSISTSALAAELAQKSIPTSVGIEAIHLDIAENASQDPLQMGSMDASGSPRHRQEKALLMERLDPKSGTWNKHHPRYRLLEALYGFTEYQERSMVELNKWRTLYTNVGKAQKKILARAVNYKKKLNSIESAITQNQHLCDAIIANAMTYYNISHPELTSHIASAKASKRLPDRVSTTQTLKHFVRDWADDGAQERNDAFPCLLSILANITATNPSLTPLTLLLPGSGLGRLGTTIADLGAFTVTLNEWSAYMNVGYRFLFSPTLSLSTPATLHPFVDSLSHHASTENLLRPIHFPNSAPNPSVLLVEGDFTTAFTTQSTHFDIVVTHFFIDTARNLLSYFETIHMVLKPGGRWVNFGPLLYGTGPFVQLSLDEVVTVVEEMG